MVLLPTERGVTFVEIGRSFDNANSKLENFLTTLMTQVEQSARKQAK